MTNFIVDTVWMPLYINISYIFTPVIKYKGGNFHFNHYDCTSKIIEKQRWKTELMIDFQKKGVVLHFIHRRELNPYL